MHSGLGKPPPRPICRGSILDYPIRRRSILRRHPHQRRRRSPHAPPWAFAGPVEHPGVELWIDEPRDGGVVASNGERRRPRRTSGRRGHGGCISRTPRRRRGQRSLARPFSLMGWGSAWIWERGGGAGFGREREGEGAAPDLRERAGRRSPVCRTRGKRPRVVTFWRPGAEWETGGRGVGWRESIFTVPYSSQTSFPRVFLETRNKWHGYGCTRVQP